MASVGEQVVLDLAKQSLREVNRFLHNDPSGLVGQTIRIENPAGS